MKKINLKVHTCRRRASNKLHNAYMHSSFSNLIILTSVSIQLTVREGRGLGKRVWVLYLNNDTFKGEVIRGFMK